MYAAPVDECSAPAPAVYAALSSVVEFFVPSPATYAAPAPVVEFCLPAPVVYAAPALVVVYIVPTPPRDRGASACGRIHRTSTSLIMRGTRSSWVRRASVSGGVHCASVSVIAASALVVEHVALAPVVPHVAPAPACLPRSLRQRQPCAQRQRQWCSTPPEGLSWLWRQATLVRSVSASCAVHLTLSLTPVLAVSAAQVQVQVYISRRLPCSWRQHAPIPSRFFCASADKDVCRQHQLAGARDVVPALIAAGVEYIAPAWQ